MFIQTEATPNPATLKFLPGRAVLESGTLDMASKEAAGNRRWPERLFEIPNVGGVFFGSDFISITKRDGDWQQIKPAILGAIMEHFISGAPLLASGAEPAPADADEFFDAKDAETVATIKDLIETRVRPAVAGDGGDITFKGFKEGVVFLDHEGRLLGLPVLDRHAPARHPEPAQAFRARSGRSAAGVSFLSFRSAALGRGLNP